MTSHVVFPASFIPRDGHIDIVHLTVSVLGNVRGDFCVFH